MTSSLSDTLDQPSALTKLLEALPNESPSITVMPDGRLELTAQGGFEFRFSYGKSRFVAEIQPVPTEDTLLMTLTCLVGVLPFTSENAARRTTVITAITALKDQGFETKGTFKISPKQALYFQEVTPLQRPFTDKRLLALACSRVIHHLHALKVLQPLVLSLPSAPAH